MMQRPLTTLAALVLGVGAWSFGIPAQAQCPPGGCGQTMPYPPIYQGPPGGGGPGGCGPQGCGPGGAAGACSPYGGCPDCPRMYHYPFYFYPHNYWPTNSPQWPEPQGKPYMPPPAYQAFPAFKEPNWRYEYWQPQRYYRGNHFLLDVF